MTIFSNLKLLNIVSKEFKLDIDGLHGIKHWESVYKNTKLLASYYNVNSDVFELFALLHDSKREDEDKDILHGKRAALFVKELIKLKVINLNHEDKNRLIFACSNHTKTNKKAKLFNDLVVQICFDADRLDIERVGLIPQEEYFSTSYAKKIVRDML